MAGSALRRLMAEYKQLSQNPPDGKSISWWELFNIFFLKLRTQVLRQDQSLRRTSLNGKLPSLDQRELSLKMGSSLQLCHFLKIILSILLRWNSSQSYFIQTFILMAESASGNITKTWKDDFVHSIYSFQYSASTWKWPAWLRVQQWEVVSGAEYREDSTQRHVHACR